MFIHKRSRFLTIAVAIALVTSMTLPATTVSAAIKVDAKTAHAKDRFLVKFKPGTAGTTIAAVNRAEKVTQRENIKQIGVRVLNVPTGKTAEQMVARYKNKKNVEFAEVDSIAKATMVPNDPYYKVQWGPKYSNAPAAWDITTGSSAVTVAIIDTGVYMNHPDIAGRVVPGYDFVNNDSDPSDDQGHGTRVAGVALANGNNSVGVAGMDWHARIMPVKVLDSTGSGSTSIVAQGITYAADKGARVLNLSLGGGGSSTMQAAVRYAYGKGCVIAAASGNQGSSTVLYPAGYAEVIAVGATNFDVISSFSSYGAHLDVAAPGEGIDTITRTGGYGTFAGTSAATPFVAGLAALILAKDASASPATVMSAITSSARDLGVSGWDQYYGWGHIDAAAALATIAGTPVPEPAPAPVPVPEPTPVPEPVDVVAPTVQLVSPNNGSMVSGTLAIEATASDDRGVARVEFWIDGKLVGTDTGAPYSMAWATTKYANGLHSLYVKALDAAGNSATSAQHVVTVSNAVKGKGRK